MEFYSTQNKNKLYSLKEAVLKGLADDKGLFMPAYFAPFPEVFKRNAPSLSFPEIAFETALTFLGNSMSPGALHKITDDAITFDAPLVEITEGLYALELFHGPTLAFKDFGARFMAALMSYFIQDENRKLTILVATSGDTGGAVANGFLGKEGIDVIILYPSGKVSPLQEKQLTTLGKNIRALEIKGTFDDCQRLVKSAFMDDEIKNHYWLSSANSINISRLIPQSFYYVYAWSRLVKRGFPVTFSVPSGNFGNLTAGLFAKKMGIPVHHFIAATNSNAVFPQYLKSGNYNPVPSLQTISNAMDVGDPSNFSRILDLFEGNLERIRKEISGCVVTDRETSETIEKVLKKFNYLTDPHGAVGFFALEKYLQQTKGVTGVFLETAHPAKFLETVEKITGESINLPEPLENIKNKTGASIKMNADFIDFKAYLLNPMN